MTLLVVIWLNIALQYLSCNMFGIRASRLGGRTISMWTIGMRTIGMEDNWHAENWHGGQLACGKLAWRTIGIDFFNCFLFNYFNVLTNNKFHFQIKNLSTKLPYKQSHFRMTYENKFCYRIIYRIIFESIVFTYYFKSNGSIGRTFCFVEISLCAFVLRLFVRL